MKTIFVFFLLLGCLFVGLLFTVSPVQINGHAMEPNFRNGDRYLVNKLAYVLSQPQRGDVITFQYTQNPKYSGIGRLIGLPGDTIKIQDGQVIMNGTPLNEQYLPFGTITEVASKMEFQDIDEETGKLNAASGEPIILQNQEIIIPAINYFIMGDNRSNSIDSRSLGFINRKDIIGKLLLKY